VTTVARAKRLQYRCTRISSPVYIARPAEHLSTMLPSQLHHLFITELVPPMGVCIAHGDCREICLSPSLGSEFSILSVEWVQVDRRTRVKCNRSIQNSFTRKSTVNFVYSDSSSLSSPHSSGRHAAISDQIHSPHFKIQKRRHHDDGYRNIEHWPQPTWDYR
jgi:hypothetical protein